MEEKQDFLFAHTQTVSDFWPMVFCSVNYVSLLYVKLFDVGSLSFPNVDPSVPMSVTWCSEQKYIARHVSYRQILANTDLLVLTYVSVKQNIQTTWSNLLLLWGKLSTCSWTATDVLRVKVAAVQTQLNAVPSLQWLGSLLSHLPAFDWISCCVIAAVITAPPLSSAIPRLLTSLEIPTRPTRLKLLTLTVTCVKELISQQRPIVQSEVSWGC